MSDPLYSWIESQQDSMVELLRVLVELESPSTDKEAVNRIGRTLVSEFESVGAEVTELEAADRGNHVRAVVDGPSGDGQLLVLGHMDTVWELGTLQAMPFRVENGRAYGPGTFDMKGGLVQLIFALKGLRQLDRRPAARVVILINSDEELGSGTSRSFIEEEARRSRAVFVLEPSLPPAGGLKTFRKGVGIFQLKVTGRAAHAGLDPKSGVSAIEEIARQIQALHRLTDHERGITINVGTVRGGSRVNVVAADAHAEIDMRVSTLADARDMEKRILRLEPSLEGAAVNVTGGIDRPPLERSPGVVALYERARSIAQEIGFNLPEGPAGGGSDGNLTAALGIPTLDGLGAVGNGAHAVTENVIVAHLPRRAAVLARLLETV